MQNLILDNFFIHLNKIVCTISFLFPMKGNKIMTFLGSNIFSMILDIIYSANLVI